MPASGADEADYVMTDRDSITRPPSGGPWGPGELPSEPHRKARQTPYIDLSAAGDPERFALGVKHRYTRP